MSTNTVMSFILNEATNEDLNNIVEALKIRRAKLSRVAKFSLRVGQAVQYNGRNGLTHGTLVKINRKNAHVRVNGVEWRVPLNMLAKAS